MKMTETNWESLDISNDFLFGKVMQNPDLCKELLQRILPDLNIECIEYPELQKSIKEGAESRGIRLDVYIKDDKNIVYNVEMQASDSKELPKRSRYYQGMVGREDISIHSRISVKKIIVYLWVMRQQKSF